MKGTSTEKGFRGISDAVVKARTGRTSKQWHAILDRWGAEKKGHTLTAKYLHDHYELTPCWAQAVTIRYEHERGLRKWGVAARTRVLAADTRKYTHSIEPAWA